VPELRHAGLPQEPLPMQLFITLEIGYDITLLFVLLYKGVEYSTYYSHGAKECGDFHLRLIADQLRLTKQEFFDLIDWELSS
jgi:hypothetical protein